MLKTLKKLIPIIPIYLLGVCGVLADSDAVDPGDAAPATTDIEINNFLNISSVDTLIGNIVLFLTWAAGSILVVMILFGAFQIMTSGGNPENLTKGRSTIVWALIGFAIILLAGGLGSIIANILGGTAEPVDGLGGAPSTPAGVIGVIDTIAAWMFGILMALGTVFVLYSAFLFLISGGDSEKVGTARRALVWAIIALVIGVLAGGADILIKSIFVPAAPIS